MPTPLFPPDAKHTKTTVSFTMDQFVKHVENSPDLKQIWDYMKKHPAPTFEEEVFKKDHR